MTQDNPFSPPQAALADENTEAAPPLWNPSAAGAWSLLFTPIFGAWIHYKNWIALGESEKAAASKNWIIASFVFLFVLFFISLAVGESKLMDSLQRPLGIAFLLAWYFSSGKAQQTYVAERFGKDYERKGWLKPLGLAVLATVGFIFVCALIGGVLGFFGIL